jgi:hypothetical protein
MKIPKKIITVLLLGILTLAAVLLGANFLRRPRLPEVVSTNPPRGAIGVSDTGPIAITFNQKLAENNRGKITVTATPPHDLLATWDETGFMLSLKPQAPLKSDTLYSLVLTFDTQLLYDFSFTTQKFSAQELKLQMEEQSQGDRVFAEAEKQLLQTHPWFAKLPLETPEYRIVYDYTRKSFRIRILKPNPSPEEKAQIMENALNQLKSIEVDPDKETYYVLP